MLHVAKMTVAIATMDRPHALARCLDALLAGEALPAEIIVVDQATSEGARQVVEQRRSQAPSLHYLPQARRGLSAARNLGMAVATEPIVAVTDDDCVPDATWTKVLMSEFVQLDSPAAVTGRVLPWGEPTPGTYPVSSRTSTRRVSYCGKTLPWLVGTGANFAVQRTWIARVGAYDERLGAGSLGKAGEDMDLLYRLLISGARVQYQPEAVVYHERQAKARRLASRSGYGYGIGACCGLWLHRSDPYALTVLTQWIWLRLRLLRQAVWHGQWPAIHEEWLVLRGTFQGLHYGWGQIK